MLTSDVVLTHVYPRVVVPVVQFSRVDEVARNSTLAGTSHGMDFLGVYNPVGG